MIYANGHFCKRDSNSDRVDANSSLKNICPSDKSSEAHRNSLISDDRIHNIPIVIRYSRTSQTNSAAVRRYLWFDGHLLPLRTAQVLSRFPAQNRRDQARQQMSVGTAHPPQRRSARRYGNKDMYRALSDFESPPDSKPMRLNAAAIASGLSPPYRSSFCIFCRNRRDRDRCVLPLQQFSQAFWAVPRFRRGIRRSASLPACAPSASRAP